MGTREDILEIIRKEWPVHLTEIVRLLDLEMLHFNHQKKHVAKVNYHVNKLRREGLIFTKKAGQAVVCWPVEIEKIRIIQEIIS